MAAELGGLPGDCFLVVGLEVLLQSWASVSGVQGQRGPRRTYTLAIRTVLAVGGMHGGVHAELVSTVPLVDLAGLENGDGEQGTRGTWGTTSTHDDVVATAVLGAL